MFSPYFMGLICEISNYLSTASMNKIYSGRIAKR